MLASSSSSSNMTWLAFALMTVAAWGLYGVFLHSGQGFMKDPENGRTKAFLFVGVAYFLTAVLAPLLVLCILLGIFPFLLLDWMDTSVVELMRMLAVGG